MKMKVLAAVAATFATGSAFAAVTGNVGAISQYDFRGISQSIEGGQSAAVQGGFDYAADSGLYLGTWASNVNWGAGHTELDLYGGYTTKLNDTFGIDVGVISYLYPEQGQDPAKNTLGNPNTVEFYAGLIVGPVTFKYFYSPSYFGLREDGDQSKSTTSNSYFLASGSYPLTETFSLTYSGGFTKSSDKVWVDGPDATNTFNTPNYKDSYFDYSLGVAKTLEAGFTASFGIVGTSFKNDSPGVLLGLKKVFNL